MRLRAIIDQVEAILLVDTGSTHNFVDFKLVNRLRLTLEPVDCLRELTASGEGLFTQGLCQGGPKVPVYH